MLVAGHIPPRSKVGDRVLSIIGMEGFIPPPVTGWYTGEGSDFISLVRALMRVHMIVWGRSEESRAVCACGRTDPPRSKVGDR